MSILGAHIDVKLNTAGQSDPWVEFIDLDMEEESSEPSCGVASDGSPASTLRTTRPGQQDDSDSGRDSCCSDHHPHHHGDCLGHDTTATATSTSSWELVQGQRVGQNPAAHSPASSPAPGPGSGDLYTQVGHVHCSGEVLLTPGEAEVEQQQQLVKVAEEEKEKQKRAANIGFQLVVVAEGGGGGVIGGYAAPPPPLSSPPPPFGEYQESCPAAYTTTAAAAPPPPPQSYTQVDGVDRQNGLLLTPSTAHAARLFAPKVVPTPEGYLTPDLLRDITP
ncbi:hypothetical protein CRUP_013194 [Coryphaenoides rupestris]|nr:hypothetical protein CRUP_013194 [Coryphaenoides rupestris]